MKTESLLLVLLLLITSCEVIKNQDDKPDKEPDFVGLYNLITSTCNPDSSQYSSAAVVDNHDGTISYIITSRIAKSFSEFCPSGNIINEQTIFYKKCLQGQVYRPEEDDCKGSGNSANFYGALKLQYCDTEGKMDCAFKDSSGILRADPEKSPANANCYNDGFSGKVWNLPDSLSEHSENNLLSFYLNRPDEIPSDFENYWGSLYYFGTESWGRAYRIGDGKVQNRYDRVTENHYIICVANPL